LISDSSAILAIAFLEPGAVRLVNALVSAPYRAMAAVNWFETLIVAESRYGAQGADKTLLLLHQLEVEAIPFDVQHIFEAQRAWRRYGKGRHPAALNMSDCAAYAAARIADDSLLFTGEGFSRTDIRRVEW
jgi:ribonuclease VapC